MLRISKEVIQYTKYFNWSPTEENTHANNMYSLKTITDRVTLS